MEKSSDWYYISTGDIMPLRYFMWAWPLETTLKNVYRGRVDSSVGGAKYIVVL